jgi:hypothetical protein
MKEAWFRNFKSAGLCTAAARESDLLQGQLPHWLNSAVLSPKRVAVILV